MIRNKNIAIIGFGHEGFSAAKYLSSNNHISIFDDKSKENIPKDYFKILKNQNIKFFFGKGKHKPINLFDLVVRSPGVRPDNPLVLNLIHKNTILTSPTNIFFNECPSQIIGITGTKGKGTTSTLIYKILKTKFPNVFLAGNIGTPMLDVLPKLSKDSKVVLELSSFQLIDLKSSPNIAVVLMVTSEHLDWHTNQKEYCEAKKNIVMFQAKNDFTVANKDFPVSVDISRLSRGKVFFFSTNKNVNGVYVKDDKITSGITKEETICSVEDVLIPGRHNLQNICAALTVAKIFNIENKKIKKVLNNFKGLDHRLQLICTKNKVKFYNDSFSTMPETTIAAIESFLDPKILIIGGSSKKSDFSTLISKIISDRSIKKIILIGKEGRTINKLFKKENYQKTILSNAKTMQEIVKEAYKNSKAGDIVLLSPGCASFDMFKDYKDRGLQFIKSVTNL